MQFLRKVRIFRRFFIALAIMAIVPSVLVVLLSTFYLTSLNARSQAVQTSIEAQRVAADGQSNLERMNALLQTRFTQIFATLSGRVNDASLPNSSGLIGIDIAARELDFNQTLTTFQSNYEVATAPDMESIRSILLNDNPQTGPQVITNQQEGVNTVASENGLWSQYQHLQDREIKLLDKLDPSLGNTLNLTQSQLNSNYTQAYSVLWQSNFMYLSLKNVWQGVVDDSVNIGKTVTSVGASLTQPLFLATATVLAFSVLLIVLVGWGINVTISRPLRNLALLTDKIAQGHTEERASTEGKDEITTVAVAMNGMLNNIVSLIQQTQSQRDLLQAQVEKLVSEVCNAGEGDLRVQAEVTADALGVLADSFNYMVEELASLVIRVKVVAQEIENSTSMTFERMSQLVDVADRQIQQIGGAAVETDRIASSSSQVAERAQSLFSSAREARQTAHLGRASVLHAVEGMGRINVYVQNTAAKMLALGDNSREIGSIVNVIANIAHQTNRLALDAAIQAAMAGENGRGFGAVAADIRRQAELAKDQAHQITRIVRDLREDINTAATSMQETEHEASIGAQLAQEAGIALESIFAVVELQGREIEDINQMATRQFQASTAIVQVMHGVSDLTERSSYSTRDVAQSMERLSRLAEQLLASVEVFKLPDQSKYAALAGLPATPSGQIYKALDRGSTMRPEGFPLATSDRSRENGGARPRTISRPLGADSTWKGVFRERQS